MRLEPPPPLIQSVLAHTVSCSEEYQRRNCGAVGLCSLSSS